MSRNDKKHWLELTEKYFNAETSEQEERLLQSYVFSTEDHAFDEVRAIMSYCHVAASQNRFPTRRSHYGIVRYAAMIAAAAGLTVILLDIHSNECVAYVNGVKVTDESKVMAMMNASASEVMNTDDELFTDVLNDMISTIQ